MNTLKILIVDDEPKMRMGIQKVLSKHTVELSEYDEVINFEMHDVETGEEAISCIEKDSFDILLLDHKLPGIQGYDVLTWISENKIDITVIMITAYASIEMAVSATKQGAFDFLAKPFTPLELKNTIDKSVKSVISHRHAKQLEKEKRQMRFQLISVVSHELKSPIGALHGYLNLLKDPEISSDFEKSGKFVDRCLIRLDGMQKLIADLLDLTKIESGQKKRELKQVDICGIVERCLETANLSAKEQNVTINSDCPKSLNMHADPDEIEIILNNLLSNAVKYNKIDGKVDLKVSQKNGNVVIKVSDTGIGMTQKEASKLFKEFVRIKNDKTKDIMGSGLGLSIVKKLAMLYGGNVVVTSAPDEGCEFTVTLNVSEA